MCRDDSVIYSGVRREVRQAKACERDETHTQRKREKAKGNKTLVRFLREDRRTPARRHAGRHARNAQFSSMKAFPDNKLYHPSSWMTHLSISSIKTIISFRKADLVVHNSLMSVCRVPGFVSGVAWQGHCGRERERETTTTTTTKKGFAFCFGTIVASLRPWRRARSLEIEKV